MDAGSKVKIDSLKTLSEFLINNDNSKSFCYISDVSENLKTNPCILGIDEAGRGPVLGPMVYGTAFCSINSQEELNTLECADSKVLTEDKREKIFDNLTNQSNKIGWGVEVISPNVICNSMLRRCKYSLNQVSMDSAVGLIRAAIAAGVNVSAVFVDTVGPPEKYQAYLSQLFPDIKITVAKKADSTYPIVSAASICAKVVRDQALQIWDFAEGIDLKEEGFGSGYPGDPTTKKFLADNCDPVFGFPQLVRFSWSTAENILKNSAYHVEWESSEDEKQKLKSATVMASFFDITKKSSESGAIKKHNFFRQRHLQTTSEFDY